MTITCASPLTAASPTVTVPGSVTLSIDLANDQGSGIADLEFVLLDPTLAICFSNGARVVRAKKVVPNIGLAVVETLVLKCCAGNLHGGNTVLPIGVFVSEKGQLRGSPSTVVTVKKHSCGKALTPLHTAGESSFTAAFLPAVAALEPHSDLGSPSPAEKKSARTTVPTNPARKVATGAKAARTGKRGK